MNKHEHHDHHHGGPLEVIMFFAGLGIFIIALFLPAGFVKNILYFSTFFLSGYHIKRR